VLKRRAEKEIPGIQNAEVRRITHLDRQQVNRLIHELEREGLVRIEGHGRGARYFFVQRQGD
jgi:DNA-binding MarR family transcriptional regulator